jgi:hypothetical protein
VLIGHALALQSNVDMQRQWRNEAISYFTGHIMKIA